MAEQDDLLSNLRKTLSEQRIESFHVLEELVPIEEQMEYFRYFERLRRENKPFVRDEEIAILYSPEASIEEKKVSMLRLATMPDVGAFRAIETYHSSPLESELKNWSAMALISGKIVLNSDLSGEQQIYISSGLGGHDNRLRFFALFATSGRQPMTDLQKEIVEREFRFQFRKAGVEIERFDLRDNYFTLLILFPIDTEVRRSIRAAVDEINQYGNFLDEKYLFTNVKILDDAEIERLMQAGR